MFFFLPLGFQLIKSTCRKPSFCHVDTASRLVHKTLIVFYPRYSSSYFNHSKHISSPHKSALQIRKKKRNGGKNSNAPTVTFLYHQLFNSPVSMYVGIPGPVTEFCKWVRRLCNRAASQPIHHHPANRKREEK